MTINSWANGSNSLRNLSLNTDIFEKNEYPSLLFCVVSV
jgi:hypothetical protein